MKLKEGDIIAVNKPKGPTSHDIIYKIRKITGIKKVGHAGTLDPLATGVLVIAVGRSATKLLDKYVKGEKEYQAVIKLGETSTTDDEEGEKTKTATSPKSTPTEHSRMKGENNKNNIMENQNKSPDEASTVWCAVKYAPSEKEIKKVLKNFIGKIQQTPPKYSAIKIKGQRAYKYARQGQKVEMQPRQVEINNIKLKKYNYPLLTISVRCNKGVYIRSLARDIGEKLGTGAYLKDLTRTRVGNFTLAKSLEIEEVTKD